ncbi:uncharacterized protein LOC135463348 [Liolophura sinensis]|uniref:uncharacterized protein LOC135463348 n=1 Tax=Liolophura sinensis TaxID=3198878 RepID=UPI0031592EF3
MEGSAEGNSEEALKEDGAMGDDLEESLKKMKPPNRKKFDEEIESILKIIREKEAEIKGTSGKPDDTKGQTLARLRAIRAEKEATIDQRKKIDISLKALNTEITKSMGALSRLQSNLHYKSEEKIEEAIRRLDYQLKNQNFRLSEEKKIVAEIDSLKRSKKVLSQFLAQKKEVDEMRAKQRKLREDREVDYPRLYKQVSSLKSQEDDLRRKNSVNKSKNETVKKELDELYEQKRHLVSEFKKYEKEYYGLKDEVRKKQRQESLKKREEEKRAHVEAQQKELAEYESQKEPFEDEKLLCNTLITYLQRFLTTDLDPSAGDEASPSAPGGPAPAISHQDGMYVLLKKPDEELFGGISRKGKKGSKKKKLPMHKPVTHTPQIFSQFSSLALSAPSNISEVPACLEKLQGRKEYYENFVGQSSFLEDQSLSSLSVSVSDYGGDSFAESLQSESGVSTTWSLQSNDDCEEVESACESFASEMKRQTSKTESTGSTSETATCDSIVEALATQGHADPVVVVVAPSPSADDDNSSPECDMGKCDKQGLADTKDSFSTTGDLIGRVMPEPDPENGPPTPKKPQTTDLEPNTGDKQVWSNVVNESESKSTILGEEVKTKGDNPKVVNCADDVQEPVEEQDTSNCDGDVCVGCGGDADCKKPGCPHWGNSTDNTDHEKEPVKGVPVVIIDTCKEIPRPHQANMERAPDIAAIE